ncbi:MAG: iron-sulfur cluster assembly accessory protein [Flammeovirgaceae bacterium]|nr:iron-sulfur cluster assembly accessory protein [Flammeovirgaceae bacterium]|tara:strand:+ start:12896 stop:13222 length:327 start_codon:yes stop_codon:yes gene_type:complete
MAIKITEEARLKVIELLDTEDYGDDYGLRVKVRGGGCSGMQYQLGFDQPQDGDKIYKDKGLTLMVDIKSLIYLTGSTIDYAEGLMGAGFSVNNPNVRSHCGCGESFAV